MTEQELKSLEITVIETSSDVKHILSSIDKLLDTVKETQISINTIVGLQAVEREKRTATTEDVKEIKEKTIKNIYEFIRDESKKTNESIKKSAELTALKYKNWLFGIALSGIGVVVLMFLKDLLLKRFI